MDPHTPPPAVPPDDPLAARLERLAQRRVATGRPAALPPPRPGTGVVVPPSSATLPGAAARRAGGRPRRRHPAAAARLGALAVSLATAGGLLPLLAGADNAADAAAMAALPAPVTPATTATPPTATTPTTAPAPSAPARSPATAPTTSVAASSAVVGYDGALVQTRYGPVQVQAQVSGGVLVDVAVKTYPSDDGKSVRINQRALPVLRSEALSAQSAEVDTVSGATYTSTGYARSLQAAIDAARAAGALTTS